MGTWVVGAIVSIIVAFAGYSIFKNRKRGEGCGCCDGCDGCGVKNIRPKGGE